MARKSRKIAPADETEADKLVKHEILVQNIKLNIEAAGPCVTEMFELSGPGRANTYPGTIVGPLPFPGYAGVSLQPSPPKPWSVRIDEDKKAKKNVLKFSLFVSELEFTFLRQLLLMVGPNFPDGMGLVVAAFTKQPFLDGSPGQGQRAERHAFYLSADWRPRSTRRSRS